MLLTLLACASAPRPDIVLVSLDTTRADVIDAETTPTIWALAERGARFTAAFTHAPSTLSSHASVWTGRDPHAHGVPANGYPLGPDLPALPERLSAAGFDTAAVIGASPLARPMGMDRGFSRWDEDVDPTHQGRHEARAPEVTDRALQSIRERHLGARLFFVHHYDAHTPWQAPAAYAHRWTDPGYQGAISGPRAKVGQLSDASRSGALGAADLAEARARYRGEVAYVDAELGRLLTQLDAPLVAIFGDHGEAIGDVADRPWGHGPDVDLPVTRVPLIVCGPGVPAAVIDTPVALSDVGATVLRLAGVSGGLGEGRDLSAFWTRSIVIAMPRCMQSPPTAHHRAHRVKRTGEDSSSTMVAHPSTRSGPYQARATVGSMCAASGSVRIR